MTAVTGWNLLLTTFGVTLVQGVFYSQLMAAKYSTLTP